MFLEEKKVSPLFLAYGFGVIPLSLNSRGLYESIFLIVGRKP
jgi:hypothetical protein